MHFETRGNRQRPLPKLIVVPLPNLSEVDERNNVSAYLTVRAGDLWEDAHHRADQV